MARPKFVLSFTGGYTFASGWLGQIGYPCASQCDICDRYEAAWQAAQQNPQALQNLVAIIINTGITWNGLTLPANPTRTQLVSFAKSVAQFYGIATTNAK